MFTQYRTDKLILLLVNPNAGGGKAKRLLEVALLLTICSRFVSHLPTHAMQRVVKPMLLKAKVQYDTLLTQRQGHGGEICQELGRKILDGTCKYQVVIHGALLSLCLVPNSQQSLSF